MEKIVKAEWQSGEKLVVARLSGIVNLEDIQNWKNSLYNVLNLLPDNSSFKMLVDLHGFEAENMETHKEYRTIIPLLLADYNYRIGYLDMFPEASVELKQTRGINCIAMANVHHNADKMLDYQTRFGNEHEHYFTESDAALAWIKNMRQHTHD
ncbi:hypothetical protein [Lacibacter sediminis]|uniref:STAS/SEC14 domain-containing protein n=1 Tax=Lacibacter sediminis TaxID=2760713 RepID=A0A7G5XKD6_9BACT|nr:hypothetical protein [Lacibacter sediminis]QNA45939.1 hypothetical protein H4075_07045 [Lacibacter sediminis]